MEKIITVKVSGLLTKEQAEQIIESHKLVCEKMDAGMIVCDDSTDVRLEIDTRPLLNQMLEEQRKTNELLAALVDALAEDGGDPDAPPAYYMDGSPVRG